MVRRLAARGVMACLLLMAVAASCRHERDEADNSLALSDPDKVWYDSAGTGGSCEPPATACPAYQDEKTFVDTCVAKGFQAKTCGCSLRCSGLSGYVKPVSPVAALALTAGQDAACPPESKAVIAAAAAARKPGSDLDHCIDSHVCNGNLGGCTGDERVTTTRLRAFARQRCSQEVIGTFCKDTSLDTLNCSDSDIAHLSRTYSDAFGTDASAKRCFRSVVCTGDKGGCTPDGLKSATAIKATIDKDGCQYWLRLFCNIGPKAW